MVVDDITQEGNRWSDNLAALSAGEGWDAFAVDHRFLVSEEPGAEQAQFRLGASYGKNLTSPDRGILEPHHVPDADYVFLLHAVIVDGRQLSIWDQGLEARSAPAVSSASEARQAAQAMLASISDAEFELLASESATLPEVHSGEAVQIEDAHWECGRQ